MSTVPNNNWLLNKCGTHIYIYCESRACQWHSIWLEIAMAINRLRRTREMAGARIHQPVMGLAMCSIPSISNKRKNERTREGELLLLTILRASYHLHLFWFEIGIFSLVDWQWFPFQLCDRSIWPIATPLVTIAFVNRWRKKRGKRRCHFWSDFIVAKFDIRIT